MLSLRFLKRLVRQPDRSPVAPPDESVRTVRTLDGSIVDALTPARLITLLRAADQGDVDDQVKLFEAMEDRDAKLDGFMRQRKLGLLRCGWSLQERVAISREPRGSGKSADAAAMDRSIELCQQTLDEIPALDDRLFDLLDALGKGFAALEIIWDTSEKQWWPRNLEWRPQSWLTLSSQGDALHLKTAHDPCHGEPLNPANWILHRHRARSGFDPRTGLYRSCARPFVVRNYGWKDWLAFAEIFGMPLRLGKLRQGATQDEKNLMWKALRAIGVDAAALIPEGSEIEFPTAQQSGARAEIFEGLIKAAEDDYVIAILGQRLTTGGEAGGSYALGKVHEGVRHDLVEADAHRLAETLRSQLLAPLVRLNIGPDAPVPQWRWDVQAPEDLLSLSRTIKTLADAGLAIPTQWVRDRFRVPAPQDGEEVLHR